MNDIEPQDICRFCHESIELPKEIDQVISPCRCKGSQELVHIDCFNKWGKTRCEICKFRYYAGEIATQQVSGSRHVIEHVDFPDFLDDDSSDDDLVIPEPNIQNNIDPVAPVATGVPAEITNMINVYSSLMPEETPNEFRVKAFWLMTSNLIVTSHFGNIDILETTRIYLWFLNEFYKIKNKRIKILLSTVLIICYCILGLILSPALYIYHLSNKYRLAYIIAILCILIPSFL
jgi:hypothetical protein